MKLSPLVAVALLAGGCQIGQQTPEDQAKVAECRSRTDQIYRVRDRAANLLGSDQRDTPFASNYDVGDTSRGLGHLFGQDRMEANCLRGLGDAAPAPASTGPAFTPDRP